MSNKLSFNRERKVKKRKTIIRVSLVMLSFLLIAFVAIFFIRGNHKGSNRGFFSSVVDRLTLGDSKGENAPKEEDKPDIQEPQAAKPLPTDVREGFNTSIEGYDFTNDAFFIQEVNGFQHRGEGEKTVFLTFDDGPSTESTEAILDILKAYEVKATFFVWAENLDKTERQKDALIRTLKEGHAIGNHSYSHLYEDLYPNSAANYDNIMEDFGKANNKLKDILGESFETRVIRFPGGAMSWNGLSPIKEAFKANNIAHVDWNIDSTDAYSNSRTKEQIIAAVKDGIEYLKSANINQATILMHDTNAKSSTVEALPEIIQYLKEQGYSFKSLSTGQLSEVNENPIDDSQGPTQN